MRGPVRRAPRPGEYTGEHTPPPASRTSKAGALHSAGNQAVQALFRAGVLRTKLEVGSPQDAEEREAEEVASRVMRQAEVDGGSPDDAGSGVPERGRLQPAGATAPRSLPPELEREARCLRQGGEPLAPELRGFFEPRIGHDFSRVRVHAGGAAANAARALRARAYTIGPDIAFAPGEYAPETANGRRLLAHELVHVAQQGSAGLAQETPAAQASGQRGAEGTRKGPVTSTGSRVQRAPDIKPGYEGLAGLVQLAVEELDGDSRGKALMDILLALGSLDRVKLWALQLQQRRRPNGENYLFRFFYKLEAYSRETVITYVTALRGYGIFISRTSGGFQNLAYLDPSVEAPPGPVDPESMTWDRYVDNFQTVTYDLGYKPERPGYLSTTLQVAYADGTKIDISIWDISDNIDAAWQNAIYQSYIGPGRRLFPSRLSRKTTPKLWAEKHNALAKMREYNQDFELFVSIGVAGVMSNLPIGFMELPPAMPAGGRGVRSPPRTAPPKAGEPEPATPPGQAKTTVTAAEPTAILPNGQKIPPDSYSGGYHGTTLPPEVVMTGGLPKGGSDWRLLEHSMQRSDSAFRGVTQVPSDPVNQGGAAYWADKGGYVYQIKGVPTWDLNKALQGRVPTGGGTFGGNLMHGEVEYVIPAYVSPEKITRWGVVKADSRGRLYVDWHTQPPK
jgi:Domain of unknown function (DUF4157)